MTSGCWNWGPVEPGSGELLTLAERTDRGEPLPEGLVLDEEIHRRQNRLAN